MCQHIVLPNLLTLSVVTLIFTGLIFGEVFNKPLGVTKGGFQNDVYFWFVIQTASFWKSSKEKCLVKYNDGTTVKRGRDGIEYIFQETGPNTFENGKFKILNIPTKLFMNNSAKTYCEALGMKLPIPSPKFSITFFGSFFLGLECINGTTYDIYSGKPFLTTKIECDKEVIKLS